MRKIVWMFSGQGSQYFNMGRDLYQADPVFRETMNRCDETVRRLRPEPLLEVLYPSVVKDRFADFIDLDHTHPALFAVQYSLAQTLMHRGLKPDLLLGYSLGELVAVVVGGALSLEAALASLLDQARLLTTSAEPGAMLAVLDSPEIWDSRHPLFADTWVAARNAPRHFVLSGPPAALDRIQRHFQARDIVCQLLPVPVAFHSPWIDAVERPFRERIQWLKLEALSYPLVSSALVAQLTRLPPGFFWEVIRQPVRFQETVAWLEGRGAATYVDLGPFGTLATFLKYNLNSASPSRAYPIMTPFRRSGDPLRRLDEVVAEIRRDSGR